MDLVSCRCAKCDAKLGAVTNAWSQIGKKYLTPVAASAVDSTFVVSTSGTIRSGYPDTLVGGCQLQDAQCTACKANLGQKVVKTPAKGVFKNGQLIFRIGSISFKSASDGRRRAEPKIIKVLKMRADAPSTNVHTTPQDPHVDFNSWTHVQHDDTSVDGPGYAQLQVDLDAQREDINRISATGYQVVNSFETAVGRVEGQVKQLKDSIDSVRNDTDEQRDELKSVKSELSDIKWEFKDNTVVSRLDQQLQTTDRVVTELRKAIGKTQSEMGELRQEISTTQEQLQQAREENVRLKEEIVDTKQVAEEGVATSKEYASEVTSLRREMKQLRSELAKGRANGPRTDNAIASQDLDILASNISKIGNRASHIESLQMEFDLFRSRVQRLEARADASGTGHNTPRDRFSSPRNELSQSKYGGSTRQKRTSTSRDDNDDLDTTPPKRLAVTSDYSSAATAAEWQPSSPLSSAAPSGTKSSAVRRTKSGAIDKRSAKRASWSERT